MARRRARRRVRRGSDATRRSNAPEIGAPRFRTKLRTLGPASIAGGLLLLLTVLTYFPALDGKFLWDDDAHVTTAGLRSLTGLWTMWADPGATQQYYPLT